MQKQLRHLVAAFCAICAIPTFAQSKRTTDEMAPMSFEVVSIRPSSGAHPQGFEITPDGYQAFGFPLQSTIVIAYAPAPFFKHTDEVKGLPSWVLSEKYDIQAKVAPADAARWGDLNQNIMRTSPVLQRMLQQLLAERCQLRLHNGVTMVNGYVLSLDPKAARLHEDSSLPVGNQGLALLDGARAVITMKNGEEIYTFYNISMSVFANFLSLTSKQTVEDRTGLHGRYKFSLRHLKYSAPSDETAEPLDLSMPWDLHSIGMKTSKDKVSSTLWIVDSIQKPSPN